MAAVRDLALRLRRASAGKGTPAASSASEVERLRRRVERQAHRLQSQSRRIARQERRLERLQTRQAELRRELREARETGAPTTAVAELPGVTRLELRRRAVFASSPHDQVSVLEIGPAHNAILPKREGYRTRTVDYLDRAGLVERYKAHTNYDPDDIEEVDYVLPPGAAMAETIPDRFDLVVASHVLEHTTSMVDFLNECTRLLNPDGVLALVVPDHRYCFDRLRERASLGRVIDASIDPPPLHTVGTVVEERLMGSKHRDVTAWAPGHRGRYAFLHDYASGRAWADRARAAEGYIDTHNWVCTPHHLRLLLQDLHGLGLVSLRETWFHDTVRHEFFINLSVSGPGSGLTREELMTLSDDERRSLDQARFQEPSEPPDAG